MSAVHPETQPHEYPAPFARRPIDRSRGHTEIRIAYLLTSHSLSKRVPAHHNTMQALADKHAPFAVVKLRAHSTAPWYDYTCHSVKMETRKLERVYRHNKSDENRIAWRKQSRLLRFTLHQRYVDYWSEAIISNIGDPKALWSKINLLLKAPQAPTSSMHTADDFAVHFRSKVDVIRASTRDAPPPVIKSRQCTSLSLLREVTVEEITKIIRQAPAKHCQLDPAPTSLVKRLLPLLAATFANMVNASLREGVFPEILKHAIVRPRLKKPTLSPEDLNSFRPISNLSFVSKIVERVVVARFSEHTELLHLLPSRQSAYRVNHSTETAVIAVHDFIVRAIDSGEVCALVLLDLSSAFDTVDHETLLRVLTHRFGVNGPALAWFGSYSLVEHRPTTMTTSSLKFMQ
jgi:hypothetical protein